MEYQVSRIFEAIMLTIHTGCAINEILTIRAAGSRNVLLMQASELNLAQRACAPPSNFSGSFAIPDGK